MAIGGVSYKNQIKALKVGPLDSKSLAPTFDDLRTETYWVDLDNGLPYIKNGQIFSTEDGHLYQLLDRSSYTEESAWKEITNNDINLEDLVGNGLIYTNNKINVAVGNGLLLGTDNTLTANLGTGLTFLGTGIVIDTNCLGSGLYQDGDGDFKVYISTDFTYNENGQLMMSQDIRDKLTNVYTFKGSSTYESLSTIASNGDVYNITNDFTIDDNYYKKGTNVAFVATDDGGYWDPLGGITDIDNTWQDVSE